MSLATEKSRFPSFHLLVKTSIEKWLKRGFAEKVVICWFDLRSSKRPVGLITHLGLHHSPTIIVKIIVKIIAKNIFEIIVKIFVKIILIIIVTIIVKIILIIICKIIVKIIAKITHHYAT